MSPHPNSLAGYQALKSSISADGRYRLKNNTPELRAERVARNSIFDEMINTKEPSLYVNWLLFIVRRQRTAPMSLMVRMTKREWKRYNSKKMRKRLQACRSALRRKGWL